MAKYCGNCGTKWNNDAKVCGYCGYPLEDVEPVSVLRRYRKWIIRVISLVIIFAIAVIAFCVVRDHTGYRGTLKKTIHAFQEYDLNTLSSLTLMDYYDIYDIDDTIADDVNSQLDELENTVGENIKIKYEILNVYPLSDRKLGYIKSSLEDNGFDAIDWSEVINLNIRYTVKGSSATRNYTDDDLYLVKEGKKWKILYGDAGARLFG